MKILILSDDFLLDSDIIGGATIATMNVAKVFKTFGHGVSVISATKDKNKCGTFKYGDIEVKRVFSPYYEDRWRAYRSIYNIGLLNEVEKIISEVKPDVVLAHTIHFYLSFYSLIIAKKYAKKVFFTSHDIMPFYPGTFTEFINPFDLSIPNKFNYKVDSLTLIKKFKLRYNPLRNFFIKRWLNKIDGVFTVSDALAEALSQNGIKTKATIHNGIDLDKWNILDAKVNEFKTRLNINGKNIILFQGRLSGAKGGYLILQAMKKVTESCSNTVLLVAGNIDEYAGRMLKTAESFGIKDSIIFTGWLGEEEIKSAYKASTLVVVPSVCFDSFPNGNLEAFASKKPVVATCFGGSREVVKTDENGFVINPFDIESLSKSIIFLLNNPEKAKEYGENGYELVKNDFNIKKMGEDYINFFK